MNKKTFVILSAACILVLWCFQNAITVNVPWWDDFHGIILPVYDLFTEKSFIGKFLNFVSLNNEHRVVNDRIFTLLIYLVTGKFELKALALLGFVNLIGIFLVVVRVLRIQKVQWIALLPVPFLIFHAQYYEGLQSLMVPFQNFSVILYMLLSLYFLVFRKSFVAGFVFALAAIFSHGNGILVFILGAMVLLIRREYRQTALWTLLSVFTVFIYFLGYSKPEWANEAVISPWKNPVAAIRYGFEFLGAYSLNLVEISTGLANSSLKQLLPQLTGLAVVLLWLYLVLKKYPLQKSSLQKLKDNPADQFLLGMAAFFLATGVMMGLTRTGFPVLSRYTINSSFFLVALWGFYVTNYSEKGSRLVTLLTFGGVLLSYYNATAKGIYFRDNCITDAINYRVNGTWVNGYSDSSHVARVNPLLKEPLAAGAYVFPSSELDNFNRWSAETSREKADFSIVGDYLIISGMADTETFFTLESDRHQFIFPVSKIRANPKDFLLHRTYYSDLYRAVFPIHIVPAEHYRIYKITRRGNGFKKLYLQRVLTPAKLIVYRKDVPAEQER